MSGFRWPRCSQRIDLRATREQRELTRLLHACGDGWKTAPIRSWLSSLERETGERRAMACFPSGQEAPLNRCWASLGRTGLDEQLRILSEADERLRQREESLRRDAGRRAQMIRTLGVTGGAAAVSAADLREDAALNIDLLFQIAGVGILIFAVNQVLQKAGREDIAVLASVAGLVVVMFLVVDLVAQLLNNVKSIFGLY